MMDFDEYTNELILSAGKRVYAYGGNISVGASEGGYYFYYGADGGFGPHELTREEAIEIALETISLWADCLRWLQTAPDEEFANDAR